MTTPKQKVLAHFGLEDSDELDRFVDYESLARSIECPTRDAVCHILDGNGRIVVSNGVPVRVHEEVPVKDFRAELKKRSLRFIGWY